MDKSAETGQKLTDTKAAEPTKRGLLGARGFTLIELLVVMTIMSMLANVAGNLITAREKAFLTVLKADLKNLAIEQAMYFEDNYKYAAAVSDLPFVSSKGVTYELVGETRGWTARTTHRGLPNDRCSIFVGEVSSVLDPATVAGKVTCDGTGAEEGGGGYGCSKWWKW